MLSEPTSNKETTDVGRLVPAEEDTVSEASEWELHEWRDEDRERRPEAEELGAEGVEQPQFLPRRNSHGNRSN